MMELLKATGWRAGGGCSSAAGGALACAGAGVTWQVQLHHVREWLKVVHWSLFMLRLRAGRCMRPGGSGSDTSDGLVNIIIQPGHHKCVLNARSSTRARFSDVYVCLPQSGSLHTSIRYCLSVCSINST
jgi:hypothetical protein